MEIIALITSLISLAVPVTAIIAAVIIARVTFKWSRESSFRNRMRAMGYSNVQIEAAVARYDKEGWPK